MLKMFGIDTIFYTIILQPLLVIIVIMLNRSIERKNILYYTDNRLGRDEFTKRQPLIIRSIILFVNIQHGSEFTDDCVLVVVGVIIMARLR